MNKVSTLKDFTKKAVEDFVQTVVFVDDKIYTSYSARPIDEKKQIASPGRRKPATKSAAEKKIDPPTQSLAVPDDDPNFSPHDIQASFAKKRIVCSLHQPRKRGVEGVSVGIKSDTYKLCSAADIVIIDWDLYGDAGVKARVLVENLIIQSLSEEPHQIRLVIIYTDSKNLFDITSQIHDQLSTKLSEAEYNGNDKCLAFHTTNARVVVLGKPGGTDRTEEEKAFEVTEAELANRAVLEFCKLADGMLQGGILLGLAAIRKNSRKILTRFHSGLDAAFLTHRALGLPHEEAFDHITPLLIAELEAILMDSLPDPLINDTVIGHWCKEIWHPAPHATEFIPKDIDPPSFAEDLCTKGMGIADSYDSGKSGFKKIIKDLKNKSPKWPSADAPAFTALTSYLSEDSTGADLRELSVLMSQRTSYDNQHYLSLGTIIRELEGEQRYLLCLQPTCDCIRLPQGRVATFIFCLLNAAKGAKATHVVRVEKDFVELVYKPDVSNCITLEFRPSKGMITAEDFQGYEWIAQLKTKHAQRAVEQFARQLSRVGLTESEWLRLRAR
ncbi:Response receiver domain-containing protein [Candidatus Electrothrix laxa]